MLVERRAMDGRRITFDDWEVALREEVPSERQRAYREAIVKFLYWLREKGKEPIAEVFKEHLAWKQSYLSSERFAGAEESRLHTSQLT